jgi:hypothetical protein
MYLKHGTLTGPDLQKLRAPLHEPLLTIADLEKHMIAFMLASMKLSATGHGEDPYRYWYFEWFLATIKSFPLIANTMVGFYGQYPLFNQQSIVQAQTPSQQTRQAKPRTTIPRQSPTLPP